MRLIFIYINLVIGFQFGFNNDYFAKRINYNEEIFELVDADFNLFDDIDELDSQFWEYAEYEKDDPYNPYNYTPIETPGIHIPINQDIQDIFNNTKSENEKKHTYTKTNNTFTQSIKNNYNELYIEKINRYKNDSIMNSINYFKILLSILLGIF